jgi:alginate O-acetyltransferase complex protein AlgI
MLFHEPVFLFIFLPLTLAFYLLLRKFARQEMIVVALSSASLIFYGWWNPRYIWLIVVSILFNFLLGRQLVIRRAMGKVTLNLLAVGIISNLSLLFAFKYLAFAIESINLFAPDLVESYSLDLPLGISFFTFLQIAYLVDCCRGEAKETSFGPYFLFVTFFPHLIAGPLIHHSEMISQFRCKAERVWDDLAVGFSIFSVGLFKKLIPAQQMAIWADSVFDGAAAGIAPTLLESWIGALSFAFQIYFDFSGYSDMAIGLSRMFGILMPINFASPYKAKNIIEFWRRWHMTLSRFFRDYLYIPLGGSRSGSVRSFANLLVVMLLAGLWHGANWKFVIWGGVHGIFLVICHGWIALRQSLGLKPRFFSAWGGVLLTFIAVVIAWVPFRAENISAAQLILDGMMGLNGVTLPIHYAQLLGGAVARLSEFGISFGAMTAYGGGIQLLWIAGCFAFVWVLPNTQELFRFNRPALVVLGQHYCLDGLPKWLAWAPSRTSGTVIGLLMAYLCFLAIQGNPGEFIYFKF